MLLADDDAPRLRAVKKWLTKALDEPGGLDGPIATAPSGDVAYHILSTRGASVAVLEASLKRAEDEFAAELGSQIAELREPPRLVLYAHHYPSREVLPGITAAHFQLNAALAHAFIDLRRPDAPARLIEAIRDADEHLLFLHT